MKKLERSIDVKRAMVVKLKESGLTVQDAGKLKYKPLLASSVKSLGFPEAAGFRIPYFDINGKPTAFYRLRYLESVRKKGFEAQTIDKKPLRYMQPKGTANLTYFTPHFVDWKNVSSDPQVGLIITEGELKAACACKMGIPAIGLGGVWSFRAEKQKTDLLPDLKAIIWKGRNAYIAYDSDSVTNPAVMLAEKMLAEKMLELGAKVTIIRMPASQTQKVGLDDYLVRHTAKSVAKLLSDHAYEYDLSRALHQANQEVVYIRDPGIVILRAEKLKISPLAFLRHAWANRFFTDYSQDKKGNLHPRESPWPKLGLNGRIGPNCEN